MSDSSSSDGEESRFREVCDPTFWRTAAEGGVEDGNSPVQASNPQDYHNNCNNRQSFLLLEKIKTSLATSQTKIGCPWMGADGTHRRGSRVAETSIGNVAAPSTLSPYIAKQLAIRLDRSVGYYSSQEDLPPLSQECGSTDQQSFKLLKNLSLIYQDSETHGDTQKRKRRVKTSTKLSYYNSSDEEELKTRCSSVAVSPEWILAGAELCPRPHPKNVRYLDEYKVKECKSDGTIIAVPCSMLDSTVTTKDLSKRKKKRPKEYISKNGKGDGTSSEKEKVYIFQNGGVNGNELPNSNVKTERKQARKRGRRKKLKQYSEVS